ncbi:conserved hypothetical protein [delta proteobacterium NaphS2]|nr:conserved hypothetical protein [delta proteobacterium NaphS2]
MDFSEEFLADFLRKLRNFYSYGAEKIGWSLIMEEGRAFFFSWIFAEKQLLLARSIPEVQFGKAY